MTAQASTTRSLVDPAEIRGWLFDVDGVFTPTAELHMRAWAEHFTPYLPARGAAPYSDADYFTYTDGRTRFEGFQTLRDAPIELLPESFRKQPAQREGKNV